jgi:hypothetical protein
MDTNKKEFYKKTPLIKTALHTTILAEVGYIFYNVLTQSKPLSSFLTGHVNLFNSTITPNFNSIMTNYFNSPSSTFISSLVMAGVGTSIYYLDKIRGYVPKKENYEIDNKHCYKEDKIEMFYNTWITKPSYMLMGTLGLTTPLFATYQSFFRESLKFKDNLMDIVNNYSSFSTVLATGLALYCSEAFVKYATNIGKGIHEKYVLINDLINSNKEVQLKDEEVSINEEIEQVKKNLNPSITNPNVKDLEKKVRNKDNNKNKKEISQKIKN